MKLRSDNTDREPDIVLELLQDMRAFFPDITDEIAQQIEADLKARHGGRRVRINKRGKYLTDEQREAMVKDALNPTVSDEEITQRHGIHRATMYRMLKRG